ncbi:hypothetical protein Ciccas_002436 [Cichlidogyrus casuarinus]|uniref:Uncharacterized protein n=1 Tax=Cichlidogyrus casuarinus TaxID=1844966 RepID=A0ABD2QH75_9PLAT
MAAQGELMMLKNRLEQGNCMIDVQDSQGFTPFMWACANGQKATVELLLYCGANPSITGDNGETGLLLAACRGHHDVVLYLLRAGMDVNSSDELNNTALMFASHYNHVAIVSLLLDWGADLTMENADGWTALEIAMRKNSKASQRIEQQEGKNDQHTPSKPSTIALF